VERSIITPRGVLRPDRINMIGQNQAVVLDYKTGGAKPQDKDQIIAYGEGLKAMGIEVKAQLIVYLRQDPIVVNKI
jgi:RecB family exonuclease